MSTPRRFRWAYLGRLAYEPATRLQAAVRDELRAGGAVDHLLLLEHPHVYTLGRSGAANDVVAPPSWLRDRGVEVVECDRGGQVTYHGPGQLVGYPVMDLNPDRRDVRRYVRDLQEVLVRTLADYGLEAHAETRQSLIGVWVGDAKIASIGVHLSRWITTHGFALNVCTDLSYFQGIVACGLQGVRMTSIEVETGRRLDVAEVASRVAGHFADVFDRHPEPVAASDVLSLATAPGATSPPAPSPVAANATAGEVSTGDGSVPGRSVE